MGQYQDHTPHYNLSSTNSQKTLLFQVAKCLVSVGHLAWWRETWGGGGAGLGPLQKSKAFIKNAINWYQKKTQGRLEEGAEREVEREQGKEGPKPSTTNA